MKNIPCIILADDANTEIKYIYHISDIHIRTRDRHDEYAEVFNKLYDNITTDIDSHKKESLIVLTGDILHQRLIISPEQYQILSNLLTSLTKIAPVIMIAGNHDCMENNPDRIDALLPAVQMLRLKNLHYLRKSGIYQYDNILFGVISILDGNANLIDGSLLNKKFKTMDYIHKCKIALYHGIVAGARTEKGTEIISKNLRPIDFVDYDITMLGDIHRHQYIDSQKKIGYAGSLIQQNHGESLENHGYLRWNLFTGDSVLTEIANDYGYCTIHVTDGIAEQIVLPKKARIRFILNNTSELELNKVIDGLKKKDFDIIEYTRITADHISNNIANNKIVPKSLKYDVNGINKTDPELNRSIIEKYLTTYLENHGVSEKDCDIVLTFHKEIYKEAIDSQTDGVHVSKHDWKIVELKFSNMLSYGENNVINFRKYQKNEIIGILAPNHYGKSAIIDIILYTLFEKFPRCKTITNIVNVNKTFFNCSILFSIGKKYYLVKRESSKPSKAKSGSKLDIVYQVSVSFLEYDMDNDGKLIKGSEKNLVGKKKETNKLIRELVGEYDLFINTCIYLQDSDKADNFVSMTDMDKNKFMSSIFNLSLISECFNMAKIKLNKIKNKIEAIKGEIKGQYISGLEELIEQEETTLNKIQKKIKYNNQLIEYLDAILEKGQPILPIYNELIQYNIQSDEDITTVIDTLQDKIKIIEKELCSSNASNSDQSISTLNKRLNTQTNKLTKLDKQIESLNNELIAKQKKIKGIPEEFEHINLDELYNKLADLEFELENLNLPKDVTNEDIQKEIDEAKSEIAELNASIVHVPKMNYLAEKKALIRQQAELKDKLTNYPRSISKEKRHTIPCELELKEEFLAQVSDDIEKIVSCLNSDPSEDITKILNIMLKKKNKWVSKTETEIAELNYILENAEDWDTDEISDKLSKIQMEIDSVETNQKIARENKTKQEEIDRLEQTVKSLENMSKDLAHKAILLDKIAALNQTISTAEIYIEKSETNRKINMQIENLEKNKTELVEKQTKLKISINSIRETLETHNQEINELNLCKTHISLLKKHELDRINWFFRNKSYVSVSEMKKKAIDILNKLKIEQKIISHTLDEHLKTKETNKETEKKYNKLIKEEALYTAYKAAMNGNGIVDMIVKEQLPKICSIINNILNDITLFHIEFRYQLVSKKKTNKKTNKKTEDDTVEEEYKYEGQVDMNIIYPDKKPYDINLISGYEKFVINMVVRIVLAKISLSAKPNFFIIDEGWSCMDSNNLNNVDTILNYIKDQYDHVIVISHLDMIKNFMNHTIDITKYKSDSYINDAYQRAIDQDKNKVSE